MAAVVKLLVAVVVLLVFFVMGIAHIVNPDYFVARSGVRKGGELLTDWNRLGFRIVGAAVAGFALYVLFNLLSETLGRVSSLGN